MLKPFFVRNEKALVKINPLDVVALSTEGNYTRIFLPNETYYLVRASLANALKRLPPDIFIKIHRSYVASVYHIDAIYRDHLVLRGSPVPIGRRYYKSLMAKLNIIE